MFKWLTTLMLLMISFSSTSLQAGTCNSSDGWQLLASDSSNHMEIKFKMTLLNDVGWAVVNNSSSTITDVSLARKQYEYADGHIGHGSSESLGGTTPPTECEKNIPDPTAYSIGQHGEIVRLGMWVCQVSWKDTNGNRVYWAGNGCSGGAEGSLVNSGSSNGGGGGTTPPPPDPVGGRLSSAGSQTINVMGELGGPFGAANGYLDNINSGDRSLYYTVENISSLIQVSSFGGYLAAGQSRRISVSLKSSGANQLYEGIFYPSFSVKNTTNGQGSTGWIGTVKVLPSTRFVVDEGNFESYRVISQGVAFNPQSREYSVKNNTQETIQYTVTADENWLSLSPASGSLAPGGTTTITATLNQSSQTLAAGGASSLFYFNDDTHNISVRRQAMLRVFDETSPLEVSPDTAIDISQIIGSLRGNTTSKFVVTNPTGADATYYSISIDVDWISIDINGKSNRVGTEFIENLPSGKAEQITVYPNTSNTLALGTYQGNITIADINNPTASYTLPVTLIKRNVNVGKIQVTPVATKHINFEQDAGGRNTYLMAFEVKNIGELSVNYAVSSDQNWARVFRVSDADVSSGSGGGLVAPSECPCEIPASGALYPGYVTVPALKTATIYVRSTIHQEWIANGANIANISFTNTTNSEGNVTVPIQVNTVASTLPKVPDDFQVTRFNDKNMIRWDLDFTNVQNYEIEHSSDGVNFTAYVEPTGFWEPTTVVPLWNIYYKIRNNIRTLYLDHPASYYYRIRACNTKGCGDYSSTLRVPGVNQNVFTGSPYVNDSWAESSTIIATKNKYSDRIRVSWQHNQNPNTPRYNDASSFDYFLLYRSEDPSGTKTPLPSENRYIRHSSLAVEPERSNYLYYWDTEVVPGKTYYYWVKQCYRGGTSTSYDCDTDFSFYASGYSYNSRLPAQLNSSQARSFDITIDEGAPINLAEPMSLYIENIGLRNLSWSLSSEQDWLQVAKPSGVLTGGQQETINLSINSQSSTLAIGIHSANLSLTNTTNGIGNENYTVTLTVKAPPIPETSTQLDASDDYYSDRIALDWNAVSGATYYILNRIVLGNTEASYTITTTTFNDSAANLDIDYTYSLVACNSSGCSLPITDQGSRTLDDNDLDGINNLYDPDDDNDNVADELDSFPFDNSETLDSDMDGTGNNADPDDDNDGVADTLDLFPFNNEESNDNDLDSIGDNEDLDDDNDGMPDTYEKLYGLNPLVASDASEDKDGDGFSNLDELYLGTNPLVANNTIPENEVLKRSEIAKSVIQAKYGIDYIPPTASGVIYSDVKAGDFNADWIEKLAVDGITEGCAPNRYCPNMIVTKEQLAKILLKAIFGSNYLPTAATGSLFSDVTLSMPVANWIEELSNQGITEGCDSNNFCPKEMATLKSFIQLLNKAFSLN